MISKMRRAFLCMLLLLLSLSSSKSFRLTFGSKHVYKLTKVVASSLKTSCEQDFSSLGCDSCDNTLSSSDSFTFNKLTPPSKEELSDENLVQIVNLKASDSQCNDLVWKCLGYIYDPTTSTYDNRKVFPKWREWYPSPPDLIGITRKYDPEIDRPVRDASIRLVRSIPLTFKGGVRALENSGFKGYKLNELTPNKTRRAQLVNWLIYYREELFGKSLEEIQESSKKSSDDGSASSSGERLENIESLPSERQFEKHRLDT